MFARGILLAENRKIKFGSSFPSKSMHISLPNRLENSDLLNFGLFVGNILGAVVC